MAPRYHRGAVISKEPTHDETGEKLVRIPISFPGELYEWLRTLAFHQRTTMAQLVRDAVGEYRQRHDPQLGLPLPRER